MNFQVHETQHETRGAPSFKRNRRLFKWKSIDLLAPEQHTSHEYLIYCYVVVKRRHFSDYVISIQLQFLQITKSNISNRDLGKSIKLHWKNWMISKTARLIAILISLHFTLIKQLSQPGKSNWFRLDTQEDINLSYTKISYASNDR